MRGYILVCGVATVDETFYEKNGIKKISFGGKGSNQAIAISKAGCKTIFLTRLSITKQDIGTTKELLKVYRKNKICTKFIELDNAHRNDYTKVNIAIDGDNRLDEFLDISQTFDANFAKKWEKIIKNAKYVVLQLKVPNEFTKEIYDICKKNNVKIVLTPCRPEKLKKDFDLIENADIVTCNLREATEIFGKKVGREIKFETKDLNSVLKKYPNKLIVTLGKRGVKWFDGKKFCFEKSIKLKTVEDTTGAGDTFCGNLVACLFSGDELGVAIKKAICASTLKIQHTGTHDGIPNKKERDMLYRNFYSIKK